MRSHNPILDKLMQAPRYEPVPWLAKLVDLTYDVASLMNLLEAVTAREVYVGRESEMKPLMEQILRKLAVAAQAEGLEPKELLERLKKRTFHGNAMDEEYHRNNFGKVTHWLRGQWSSVLFSKAEVALALEGAETAPSELRYIERVYLARMLERGDFAHGALAKIRRADPFSNAVLGQAIAVLHTLTRENLPFKNAEKWIDASESLFLDGLRYAAESGAANAQKIRKLILARENRLGLTDIVAMADSLARQTSQSAIPEGGLEERLPWAYETVMEVAVAYGRNQMGAWLKDNLRVLARLAGDVFVVGMYLKDRRYATRTVGDFIADHPHWSAQRLSDAINGSSGPQDQRFRDLKRQFGSVVFWRLRRPGFGLSS